MAARGTTVTVVVALNAPLIAVIVVVPTETALNKPVLKPIVPTEGFDGPQKTEAAIGFPY